MTELDATHLILVEVSQKPARASLRNSDALPPREEPGAAVFEGSGALAFSDLLLEFCGDPNILSRLDLADCPAGVTKFPRSVVKMTAH